MPFFFWPDKYYILLVIPAMLVAFWAQVRVKSAFAQYSQVSLFSGLTGAQAARRIALTLSDPRLRGGAPQPCAAELRLVPLPGKTLCSITCRLDAPGAAASVAVRCGDAEPLEVRASWQEGELLLIDAVFAEETLSADDLRVAVLLSEER